MSDLRVGMGYDVHAFVEGPPLVLGGVHIEHDMGLAGHSDADVLAHALMDAILGALRAGDLGALFPDTDPAFKDISSMELLTRVGTLAGELGWRVLDADTVLVLEEPKIAPYRDSMRSTMARHLGIAEECVGVKATTTEGLGFCGRSEGVAAYAVVMMERVVV